VHEDLSALFLFSSINYIILIICDEYYKVLKNTFKLRNHNICRVFTNRMNKNLKKTMKCRERQKKTFRLIHLKFWRAMSWSLFIYEKRVVLLRIHLIVWAIDLIKCDVKTKKKLFFSKEKFFFCYSWSLIRLFFVFSLNVLCVQSDYVSFSNSLFNEIRLRFAD
jgi:hypothetical protein